MGAGEEVRTLEFFSYGLCPSAASSPLRGLGVRIGSQTDSAPHIGGIEETAGLARGGQKEQSRR